MFDGNSQSSGGNTWYDARLDSEVPVRSGAILEALGKACHADGLVADIQAARAD